MKPRVAIISVLCSIAIVLVIGCSEEVSVSEQFEQKLYGKWDWVYSQTHMNRRTPITEGVTSRVEFTADDHYLEHQNDTLIVNVPFMITEVKNDHSGIIKTPDTTSMGIIIGISGDYTECEIIGDSLYTSLHDWYDISYLAVFVRKR
jgi:hypothetical protein